MVYTLASRFIKLFSCSNQLSMKFVPLINLSWLTIPIFFPAKHSWAWNISLLINMKIPTGMKKFHAELSLVWKKFYNLAAWSDATLAGLGGSVGCALRLETRRSQFQPPPRSATFFRGDWPWNVFYSHSLPSADSIRAVISFWQKNVHNTG